MDTASNGQIREQALREHAAIRARMATVSSIMNMNAGELNAAALKACRPALLALLRALRDVLVRQSALLPPLLRETDAWGATRAARLQRAHVVLRIEIARLFEGLRAGTPQAGPTIERFLQLVSEELAKEEREVLSDEVLRDDVVVTDFSGS